MRKNFRVETWVIVLVIVFAIISGTLYGALIINHFKKQILNPATTTQSPNRFEKLEKVAVFIGMIPNNFLLIIKGETNPNKIQDLSEDLKQKPIFKRFINSNREELLILPRYDGNLNRSIVEVIDLNSFEVLHTYKHDVNSVNKHIDTSKEKFERFKIDHSENRFHYDHPLILSDGSLIVHVGHSPLFKMDICSKILWINQEDRFHHSIMLDREKNIWVATSMFPYSKFIHQHKKVWVNFEDDAITKVSLEGKILYRKSVSEILIEHGMIGLNLFNSKDPIHMNDIEPAFNDTKYWKKDDLFLSLRNLSSIIHYRPSANKIINYIQGPFFQQHDVDIISDKEISILNNNNNFLKNSKYSEVLIYNFETKSFSKKIESELKENNFKTVTQGLAETLADGSIMIEDTDHGRLIFFNNKGEKEWEFINKDDNGDIYFVNWSRIIKEKSLILNIKEKIKNKKCNV